MTKLMKGVNGHGFYYGTMNPVANPLSKELPHRFIGGYWAFLRRYGVKKHKNMSLKIKWWNQFRNFRKYKMRCFR